MVRDNIRIKSSKKGDIDLQAYLGIRKMLFLNEITPGQKVTYKDIANKLGISITPVIHALKLLEYRGIVTHESNKGYLINPISFQEIKEIYETRLLIEVSLVPESLRNLDEDGILRVQKSLIAHNESINAADYSKRMVREIEFHQTIASLSGCQIQLKILEELFDLLLLKYSTSLAAINLMETTEHEHQKIFESLQSRDPQKLQMALSEHIANAKDHVLEVFFRMMVKKEEDIPEVI